MNIENTFGQFLYIRGIYSLWQPCRLQKWDKIVNIWNDFLDCNLDVKI